MTASLPDPGLPGNGSALSSPPRGREGPQARAAASLPKGRVLTAQHPWLPGLPRGVSGQEPSGALRAETAKPHPRNNRAQSWGGGGRQASAHHRGPLGPRWNEAPRHPFSQVPPATEMAREAGRTRTLGRNPPPARLPVRACSLLRGRLLLAPPGVGVGVRLADGDPSNLLPHLTLTVAGAPTPSTAETALLPQAAAGGIKDRGDA